MLNVDLSLIVTNRRPGFLNDSIVVKFEPYGANVHLQTILNELQKNVTSFINPYLQCGAFLRYVFLQKGVVDCRNVTVEELPLERRRQLIEGFEVNKNSLNLVKHSAAFQRISSCLNAIGRLLRYLY